MIRRILRSRRTAIGSAAILTALVATTAPAAVPASASQRFDVWTAGASGNSNWAGYVDVAKAGTNFRYVGANFTVPTVTCTSSNSQASIWVGLDGKSDKTVEQVGLSTSCHEGVPVYQGWHEMAPNPLVDLGYYAHPGDVIFLSVYYTASTHVYTLALNDKTNASSSFSVSAVCPAKSTCENLDAEAIVEAAGGTNVSKFTKINFTNSVVTNYAGTHGTFATSSLWTLTESHMADTSVSATSDGGSDFSVSYSG